MSFVACDISEFQPVVDNSYPHRWLTFRVCDGSYTDHNARANLAWCKAAKAAGKLDGFAAYVVYRPGLNGTLLNQLDNAAIPTDCVVMVDVESWGNQISGDYSTEINALCTALAKRQESSARVWGYANLNDYATVWRTRPSWLGLVVASYGGQQPVSPGPGPLVGWQYTDGQYVEPGLPSSSPPFGACDHNLILTEVDMTPAELLATLRSPDGQATLLNAVKPLFVADDGHQYRVETLAKLANADLRAQLTQAVTASVQQAVPAAQKDAIQTAVETGVRNVLGSLDNAPQ